MTDKQKEVLAYLNTVKYATLGDIYNNVSFGYYSNGSKYIGEILKRLIDLGKVERIKKGCFRINTTPKDSNNLKLF